MAYADSENGQCLVGKHDTDGLLYSPPGIKIINMESLTLLGDSEKPIPKDAGMSTGNQTLSDGDDDVSEMAKRHDPFSIWESDPWGIWAEDEE